LKNKIKAIKTEECVARVGNWCNLNAEKEMRNKISMQLESKNLKTEQYLIGAGGIGVGGIKNKIAIFGIQNSPKNKKIVKYLAMNHNMS
jgi:hypothetical protein